MRDQPWSIAPNGGEDRRNGAYVLHTGKFNMQFLPFAIGILASVSVAAAIGVLAIRMHRH